MTLVLEKMDVTRVTAQTATSSLQDAQPMGRGPPANDGQNSLRRLGVRHTPGPE